MCVLCFGVYVFSNTSRTPSRTSSVWKAGSILSEEEAMQLPEIIIRGSSTYVLSCMQLHNALFMLADDGWLLNFQPERRIVLYLSWRIYRWGKHQTLTLQSSFPYLVCPFFAAKVTSEASLLICWFVFTDASFLGWHKGMPSVRSASTTCKLPLWITTFPITISSAKGYKMKVAPSIRGESVLVMTHLFD